MTARYCIGADENGLGPRLGPLVVTGVLARVTEPGMAVVHRKARGALAKRLGDSKGLVAHGDVSLAEAWSRVLVERGAGKHSEASCPDDLLDAFTLEDRAELTAPCPRHVERQCWSARGEALLEDADSRKLCRQLGRDLDKLQQRGVEIVALRSVIVCSRRLNEAIDRGQSRFMVDLHAMERLILAFRQQAGCEVEAVCGKVGGYNSYSKAFGPLGGRLHAVMEEGRPRSAYRFPGVGDIAFVRDADDSNILVGLASLVGKYLRELLMDRIVRHYRGADPSLPQASGYHDPTTRQFVLQTDALRRRRRVPATCFERRALGPKSAR